MDDDVFVSAIEAAPDDPGPRQVYADWLEQRGDPRAELVRIDGALWGDPIDLVHARHAQARRRALRPTCDPQWIVRVARPSPAELRRRVAVLAGLDRARTVFASNYHKYALNPPLSAAEVEALEARVGGPLPAQYRRFLLEVGDGGAGPAYGVFPHAQLDGDLFTHPFVAPATPEEAAALQDPPGAIPIAEVGCGGFYWLVVAGPEAGRVWHSGDHGFSPELVEGTPGGGMAAWLAAPPAAHLELIDWYAQWLDGALFQIARQTPDSDAVLERAPEHVSDINLGGRGLGAVPDGLRRMTALRVLDLSKNPIEELPPWIGELTRLERIMLSGTHLRRLPESFGELGALTYLAAGGTKTLERLPESFGRLARLESIYISSCGLIELPDSIGELALTELELFQNHLVRIPASIGRMKLTRLGLRLNRLTELPEALADLTELTHLELGGNPLATLPDCVARLPRLTRLSLGENPALDLADALRKLQRVPTLRDLSLGSAQLTALPDEIGLLTQLETLHLGWNRLTALPDSLANLTRLRSIDVQGNDASLRERVRALLPHLYRPRAGSAGGATDE